MIRHAAEVRVDAPAPSATLEAHQTAACLLFFWQRGGRDWGEHNQRLEEQQARAWQGTMDAGAAGREHARWQGMALAPGTRGAVAPTRVQGLPQGWGVCRPFFSSRWREGPVWALGAGAHGKPRWSGGVRRVVQGGQWFAPAPRFLSRFCMFDQLAGLDVLKTKQKAALCNLFK